MHIQKLMFNGKLVKNVQWKQTDGRTVATDCFIFPTNAVGNSHIGKCDVRSVC